MVSIEEMKKAEGKHVNIYFNDGDIWYNKKIEEFYEPTEENEEYALMTPAGRGGSYELRQSEIERIEILD